MDRNFFGLNPTDRPLLHSNIFDLIWVGEGRWDWNTIYNWPVYLRIFYIKKLNKTIQDKHESIEKAQQHKTSGTKQIEKGPF